MFGSKRKRNEQIKDIFERINQQRVNFETSVGQLEESRARVQKELSEVMENTEDVAKNAMLNIEEESKAISNMDVFSKEVKTAIGEYAKLKEKVEDQYNTATALVEENKHFTSPAKYMSEIPNTLKQTCKSYEKQLDDMAEYGKNMGVLALNAAIEAGRMGESGKSFVSAAEEIRQIAISYEKAAVTMKEEVEASHARIAEMEDVIMHLISMLKERNIGTAKLLKKCQDTQKFVEKSSMRDFSEDLVKIRDNVVNMRNLDEEISKNAERNKLQLDDIQEDVQGQKKELAEMESDLLHLLDAAEKCLK